MADVGRDIDRVPAGVEQIEILREALPTPRDALVECCAGNVLDALHQLHQPFLLAGADRGETDAAVAGNHGGDTVPARRLEQAVPCGLTVVVSVDVDEAGRDDETGRFENFRGVAEVVADSRDPTVADRDVGEETWRSRPVDDGAASDDQIVDVQLITAVR